MSSNYTGVPTGEQPPAAIPGPAVDPIIVLPVGTDPFNVDTMFVQQYKVLADYISYLQQTAQGFGRDSFFLYDDFTGSAANLGKWDTAGAGITFPSDPANGGLAILNADSSIGTAGLLSSSLVLSTLNFTFEARLRWPNYADVNAANTIVGFVNLGTPASNIWIRVYRDGGGGATTHHIMLYEGASAFDSGYIVDPSRYYTFKITRVGNILTWKIDGITVRTNSSFTTNFDYVQVFIDSTGGGTSGAVFCDYIKLLLPLR